MSRVHRKNARSKSLATEEKESDVIDLSTSDTRPMLADGPNDNKPNQTLQAGLGQNDLFGFRNFNANSLK